MIVYLKIPYDVYEKWIAFNKSQGTAPAGRYAGIGAVNAHVFISQIKKIMDES